MAGWFVRRGDKVVGPYTSTQLKQSVDAGKLKPTDELAKSADGPWTKAAKTSLFAAKPAEQATNAQPPQVIIPAPQTEVPERRHAAAQSVSIQNWKSNGLGVAGFVTSLVGVVTCGLLSPFGFLFSLVGLLRQPRGLAIAGAILGAVGTIGFVTFGLALMRTMADIDSSISQAFSSTPNAASSSPVPVAAPMHTEQQSPPGPVDTDQSFPPKADKSYADGTQPFDVGDVRLRLTSAAIDKVKLRDAIRGASDESAEKRLVLRFEITNTTQARKIDIHSLQGPRHTFSGDDVATAKDDFGNQYKRVGFGAVEKVEGAIESESLYPGAKISDVVVFEAPVDKADSLFVELPAESVGGKGRARVLIPMSAVARP